jgi:hypothetical protein
MNRPPRHWPRGIAGVIADLQDGATVPAVVRRHGVNHVDAMDLARRVRRRLLSRDDHDQLHDELLDVLQDAGGTVPYHDAVLLSLISGSYIVGMLVCAALYGWLS